MKKGLLNLVTSVLLLLASSVSHAITISFVPSAQSVSLGSSVDVGIKISDLGNFTIPSLSTFDLDVAFDPAILAFDNAVYGDPNPVLGDQLDLLSLGFPTMSTTPSAGSVNVFELSFNTIAELINNQADSFILATLTFNTLSRGTSGLGISINALGDENGDPLTANIQNGSITVPEPLILSLLGIGSLGLIGLRNKCRRGVARQLIVTT